MGITNCWIDNTKKAPPYISSGKIITVIFRADIEGCYRKQISIHDENILRKAISMYLESISKQNLDLKKAVYESTSTELPLNKKLKDLDVDFNSAIILFFND